MKKYFLILLFIVSILVVCLVNLFVFVVNVLGSSEFLLGIM